MNLYITADSIGVETGGGLVTRHESESLQSLGSCTVLQRTDLDSSGDDPWKWDNKAFDLVKHIPVKLAHFYSGTFSRTIERLKDKGVVIVYTIAAHDKKISRTEHEKLGFSFPYLHLTDSLLWARYVLGYSFADVIICPGLVPANTVRGYGPEFEQKRIEIIPHGCHVPEEVKPLPERFVVGYLGCCSGPDKGVVYLVRAWKKLNYKDATLVLAGKDSTSDYMFNMVDKEGGGNIHLAGWQKNVSDFYNSISLFVCPATTEGFNLETLEAMAHSRPVICSDAAGAVDLVRDQFRFMSCDVDDLCERIQFVKKGTSPFVCGWNRGIAEKHTWDKIRERYVKIWKELL